MELSSALVGPNISPHHISIAFAHYISNVITFATILVGSPPGVDNRILQIKVNTVAADALAHCITVPSAAMVLNMQGEQVLVFHQEGFQLPTPWEIILIKNTNIFL